MLWRAKYACKREENVMGDPNRADTYSVDECHGWRSLMNLKQQYIVNGN